MSKSTLQHDRDRIASNALRAAFPTHWLYKSPRDNDSGKEYSEDWIIEIVNDDEKRTVTGVEFGVQNKTDLAIRKRYISVVLDVDDIERLRGLPRPIIIHAYDIDNNVSYWLWLEEWLEKNDTKLRQAKLKRQKQISVKIPKRNILDANSVQNIRKYAMWRRNVEKVHEKAGIVNRQYSQDYAVNVVEGRFSVTTIVNPKHEEAIPVIEALDESASAAMIRAIETGEPTPLIGNFTISNVPEVVLDGMGSTLESAWILPIVPEHETSALKIEFLDESGEVIFKSPYLLLRHVKPGTIISGWQGKDTKHHVTYTFTVDRSQHVTNYHINFNNEARDVRELKDFYDLLDRVYAVQRLRITNLQTEAVMERDFSAARKRDLTPEELAFRRLANALVTINEALDLSLQIPERFTGELIDRAEWIAEAIREGAIKVNSTEVVPEGMVLICDDPAIVARHIFEEFEHVGTVGIHLIQATTDMKVEILGKILELGNAHWSLGNVKIINVDELRNTFLDIELKDDASVRTIYDIDRDEVYLKFVNWPRKEDEKEQMKTRDG